MTILVVFVSCSKLAEFSHVTSISVEQHCPVIFFAGLTLKNSSFIRVGLGLPLETRVTCSVWSHGYGSRLELTLTVRVIA